MFATDATHTPRNSRRTGGAESRVCASRAAARDRTASRNLAGLTIVIGRGCGAGVGAGKVVRGEYGVLPATSPDCITTEAQRPQRSANIHSRCPWLSSVAFVPLW